ncbi:hypothetical protein RCL_jg159.t1 [Rhizophagus clarus]|uniref:Uncharacterized protein n=1 Tax=Rhizophagus clarus TaxID=94130 RepID=A0A8H3QI16_9GLOM|nr:hypothetical protein RCL_jg159.t1 [Rhizophagus clarus]
MCFSSPLQNPLISHVNYQTELFELGQDKQSLIRLNQAQKIQAIIFIEIIELISYIPGKSNGSKNTTF